MTTLPAGPASLPPPAPAARELMEVLWHAPGPRSTRAVHDATARRYPARAGRAIQTTATLLTALMKQGGARARKRSGTRWVYEPAVSRSAGFSQLAERAVEAFCLGGPSDGWYLVRAALGRLDLEEPARRRLRSESLAAVEFAGSRLSGRPTGSGSVVARQPPKHVGHPLLPGEQWH
jgi:predicted transcriptional regulator